jgi:hypothetical protein
MSQDQQQPYDSALKSLMGDEVAEILPKLLPESEYIDEQNIEIDRTTLRADLVYNINYRDKPHILNMELQTDADSDMVVRMLKYHVGLYDKHRKPVISMVIYPFETSIPESPFREESGKEILLTFHFRVLPLWKLDAQQFIRDHVVCMYTLLPAMKGANALILKQAIEEMKQRYKEPQLGHHLVRFRTILRRSTTLSEQDKQAIEKELHMYDSLLEQDPFAEEMKVKGEVRGLQRVVVNIIRRRFPNLEELAQQRVLQIMNPDDLDQLVVQISDASNEAAVRRLLNI